ncbi:tetratricopeptide repeat protein [Amycolatopsis pithecellobii]|uniref:Tetratricopeptide repeat protein n=1 Tax=Amycolatopsis pithecellobii TaxID=664692 RepID=A0A6N7Z4G6_9PSEU|nr:tetratricopeptide repeat protein [Amycolatopsis pithecellobii]MTD55224.1 tetratricopeptide repeat protein [Amycolatopsis pithecellobii]
MSRRLFRALWRLVRRVRWEPAGPLWRPLDIRGRAESFVGGGRALKVLDKLREPSRRLRVIGVAAASGMGASQLMHYWVSLLGKGEFTVKYIDLKPVSSDDEIVELRTNLMLELGVEAEEIAGAGEAELWSRYWVVTREKRLILILENAKDGGHVRKLLPGPGGSVIVTSRELLPGLDGVYTDTIALGRVEPVHGRELLAKYADRKWTAAELAAVDAVVAGCGGNPLVLRLAGWLLTGEERLTLRGLAATTRQRPGAETILDLCYARLGPDAAKMLGLLGAHAYPPVLPGAAAALADLPPEAARPGIAQLIGSPLVKIDEDGRIDLPGLIRRYAAAKAPPDDAAPNRLIRWHIASIAGAGEAFAPGWVGDQLPVDASDLHPLRFRPDEPGLALDWMWREVPTVLALMRVLGAGQREAWQLLVFLMPALFVSKPRGEWRDLARLAERNAREAKDDLAVARCLHTRAWIEHEMGQHEPAVALLEEALRLHAGLNDPWGLAWTLHALGACHAAVGRHAQARECLTAALDHFRWNWRFGAAILLWTRATTFEGVEAVRELHEALTIARRVRNGLLTGLIHHQLGLLHRDRGDARRAQHHFKMARELRREAGDRWGETESHRVLTQVRRASGPVTRGSA